MLPNSTRTKRYFLLSFIATGSALVVVFMFLLGHRWYAEREYMRQNLILQAELIGNNASAALAFQDRLIAQQILRTAAGIPHLQEIALFLPSGRLLAHYAQNDDAPEFGEIQPDYGYSYNLHDMRIVIPIKVDDKPMGSIALLVGLDQLYMELGRFSLALLASAIAATLLGHIATKQLRKHMAATEKELQHMALFDRVTDLPNRYAFELALDQQIHRHTRSGGSSALLFIDVDGFKRVNDIFGHQMGDVVLHELGERLSQTLRNADIIARIGGDEFGIILLNTDSPSAAAHVAQNLIEVASTPFELGVSNAHIGLSIGISMIPDDGDTATMQMLNADLAMYHAKQNGKNQHKFFSEALGSSVKHRLSLENALQKAIDGQQFRMVYQPQLRTGNSEAESLEALIRWQHPERGFISPADFIPIAEESGLIINIGRIVIEQVCRDIALWRGAGLKVPRVAINISARQLEHGNLLLDIRNILRKHALAPHDIEIELTESMLMDRIETNQQQLYDFQALGLAIAVDDFGTGYSSLSYLQRLPLSKLKIDMSFVRELEHRPESIAIVRGIISMAHAIDLKVVAEGVETEAQASILNQCHCDLMQGYLLGKPMSFADISRTLPPATTPNT